MGKRKFTEQLKLPDEKKAKSVNFKLPSFEEISSDITALQRLVEVFEEAGAAEETDVVRQYLSGSDASDIMGWLEGGEKRKMQELRLVVRALLPVLRQTASELSEEFGAVGVRLVDDLVVRHLRVVLRGVEPSCKAGVMKETLQLLMAMASQGFESARALATSAEFRPQLLRHLVERRDQRDASDVRACVAQLFAALFIVGGNVARRAVLEKRGMLNSMMPGLCIDKFSTLKLLLDHLYQIASSSAFSKTQKIRLFDRAGLQALARIFSWCGPGRSLSEGPPDPSGLLEEPQLCAERLEARQLVHRLLLLLASNPKLGIVFNSGSLGVLAIPNNALLVLLKALDPSGGGEANSLEAQLVGATLAACPDLLSPFLTHVAPLLEPRDSPRWRCLAQLLKEVLDNCAALPGALSAALAVLSLDQLPSALANVALLPGEACATLGPGLKHEQQAVRRAVFAALSSQSARLERALSWLAFRSGLSAPQQLEAAGALHAKFLQMVQSHIPVDIEDKACRMPDLSDLFDLKGLKEAAEVTDSNAGKEERKEKEEEEEEEEEGEKEDSMEDLKPEIRDLVGAILSSSNDAPADELQEQWPRFLRRGLKYHFKNAQMLAAVAKALRSSVKLKPGPKEVFEMVTGHSQFRTIILPSDWRGKVENQRKEALVDLLSTLVRLKPSLCEPGHVIVLLAAYNASLTSADQKLLSLIHFYESEGTNLDNYQPFIWGPRVLDFFKVGDGFSGVRWRQPNISSVLSLLNEKLLLTSALQFPSHRPWLTDNPNCFEEPENAAETLDPAFLLPLFRLILDACSQSQLDVRIFFSKNALCLCIAGLSARSRGLRAVARELVARFAALADPAKFPERDLLLCVLRHLRNSLPMPDARLPAVHAGFYVRTVTLLAKPEHRMFGVIWKFLLAKPSLNLRLVPEFERLLYSTHIEHRVDRQWLLSVLVDGMREPRDYLVMERSRVFKHVFALSQSRCVDATTQLLALRLVERAVRLPSVAFLLLFHHHLLSWLAISFRRDTNERQLAVLQRILEAISRHVTAAKSSANIDALRQEIEAVHSISRLKASGV